MQKLKIMLAVIIALLMTSINARNNINIVGSSTVFPFSTVVAETFGKKTNFKTPKVESTGSGGGVKLFCKGNGVNTPDIVNTSRRIKITELQKCQKNGVSDITEVLIGFDGIIIANSNKSKQFNISLRDLYLALAAKVPANTNNNKLINNPYTKWNQINPKLPNYKIKVLGPPPTSGTRDVLQEIILEGGCKTFSFIKAMQKNNIEQYKSVCMTVREDGFYVEMSENDNLIISKLTRNRQALGIFGFSFLEENADKIQSSIINNKEASFENIKNGSYPVSRPLYFYIKNTHRNKILGMNEFIREFISINTIGEDGYLVDKGLIPASDKTIKIMQYNAKNAIKLSIKSLKH